MADRLTVDTHVAVDVTLVVKMGTYGSEWEMEKIFEQVMKEATEKVRNMFDPSRVSGYTIKKMSATAVYITKERT